MPTTPLVRLLFAQGGKCFFCEKDLPRTEASIEHLVASANGGSNNDGNCVACCQAFNALLGCMSLKEKFRVVLNQRGSFRCPNDASRPREREIGPVESSSSASVPSPRYLRAVANLKQSGKARPRKPKTLRNHIATLFREASAAEIEAVIAELKAAGKLTEGESEVVYTL